MILPNKKRIVQVELARMREEIEHRETAKKLEKQLKRELYEARFLFFRKHNFFRKKETIKQESNSSVSFIFFETLNCKYGL